MAFLNQIIAIEKGIKSRVYGTLTEINKAIQKPDLFNGLSRTYQPKDDSGEQLPPEGKRVQMTAKSVLDAVEIGMSELFDVTARKDFTNCVAKADVAVGSEIVIKGAPVSFLLFMEKQLNDLRTLVSNLPTLDPAETWTADPASGLFRTDAVQTHRTKKEQRPVVLYPATPEHPAQTGMITEDILTGFWTLVKQSGAIPQPEKEKLLRRVDMLARGVKQAREQANMAPETDTPPVGSAVFGWLLR